MWTVSRKTKTVRRQSCGWTRDTGWIAAVFALSSKHLASRDDAGRTESQEHWLPIAGNRNSIGQPISSVRSPLHLKFCPLIRRETVAMKWRPR
jgi:hypothetical protein